MNIKAIGAALFAAALLFTGCASTSPSTPAKVEVGTPASDLAKADPKVQQLIKKFGVKVVSYKEVKAAIGDGTRKGAKALIIDARPVKKYITSHIPSAINIPDTKFDDFYGQMKDTPKNKPIIVYCGGYKCAKSPKVAGMLKAKGFTNLSVYIAGEPEWKKVDYIEVDMPVVQAAMKKNGAVIIDARPYKKFLGSTIPGSIAIPDTEMAKFEGRFPTNKTESIITFCGGYDCHKSHVVANRLIELGYTNVKVYAAGLPEWKKSNPTTGGGSKKPTASAAPKKAEMVNGVMKGEDEGTIDGEWFFANLGKLSNVQLVDVRPEDSFKAGHIPGAINVYAEKLDGKDFVSKLPKDKVVVFSCASGARAMEAWTKATEAGADADKTFYFDANINCDASNVCKIEPNEPLGL